MTTEKGPSFKSVFMFSLALCVTGGTLWTVAIYERKSALAAAFEEGRSEGARYAIGYPASTAELEDNDTYWVNASIVEEHPERTNRLAVLQKVASGAGERFLHTATNRLFELPEVLSRGRYYRAFVFQKTTNEVTASFVEVPPPLSHSP